MDYFELIFYQSLIPFVFHHLAQCEVVYQYELKLDVVTIEGEKGKWESVYLSKLKHTSKFTFDDVQLRTHCGGIFPSAKVEILEVFNRAMRLSLIPRESEQLVFINMTFSEKDSVQLFFQDIRSCQRKNYGDELLMEKLFQYQVYNTEDNEQPLKELAEHGVFYAKTLSSYWFPKNPKSFNFAHHGSARRFRGVHLVVLSKTFNISERISYNKFILCSANVPTHIFILQFPNYVQATKFHAAVADNLNDKIPCLANYVPFDLSEDKNLLQILDPYQHPDSLRMPGPSQHPHLSQIVGPSEHPQE